ncbi:NADP-dependent isocitrate dehydrogenase [bacterium]|nr:NADP-dependent isocitrate dehydrogenase [bacterium]
MEEKRITVAYGDGIGPEIMSATLEILDAAGAQIATDVIEIGEQVYRSGNSAGIAEESWQTLLQNGVFLKAPITTPQGGGYKSLNVTIRKTLGLYANIRPCRSYAPFVRTKHPEMDLVVIRENEEDLYGGIEHRQTDEVYQCLKLISRPGCERIARYCFEFARQAGRKKVTCFTKDNIMKMTDGLFRQVFSEVGRDYPDIEQEHWIIDIGAAKLADTPEAFDVILVPNLYGDIVSDIAAQIGGSVGLAGSANIGESFAMFEAIHGSAPDIAGKGIANPSGLLLGAIQMLVHIGQGKVAEKIHNGWLKTIEDGIHTGELYQEGLSKKRVGTKEFANAVKERLGESPSHFAPVQYGDSTTLDLRYERSSSYTPPQQRLVGVDVFLAEDNRDAESLAERLNNASNSLPLSLEMITNRGTKVWPHGRPETFCTDHWRCRFSASKDELEPSVIWKLLELLHQHDLRTIKTENLYYFGDERGFSLGQGQK